MQENQSISYYDVYCKAMFVFEAKTVIAIAINCKIIKLVCLWIGSGELRLG